MLRLPCQPAGVSLAAALAEGRARGQPAGMNASPLYN